MAPRISLIRICLFLYLITTTTALFGIVDKLINIISWKVCYNNVGCFSNKKPFNNAKGFLPQSPGKIGTKFLLNTGRNILRSQSLNPYNSKSLKLSKLNKKWKTVIIIHGYSSSANANEFVTMKNNLLKKMNLNVIRVDWSKGAHGNYLQAVANTRLVGTVVANLIKKMKTVRGMRPKSMHIIGHSLGSHVAGYAGEIVKGIGRITGLDPAGPLFEKYESKVRLSITDAIFVDVIHTDAKSLENLGLGIRRSVGHVDFYPNGGKNQPGCKTSAGSLISYLLKLRFSKVSKKVACSHMRVIDLFNESINSACVFISFKCASMTDFKKGVCRTGRTPMGYHAKSTARGRHYLSTNSKSPFCKK